MIPAWQGHAALTSFRNAAEETALSPACLVQLLLEHSTPVTTVLRVSRNRQFRILATFTLPRSIGP